jgi:hypothetical protein
VNSTDAIVVGATLAPGLFFCGLIVSATGQLREIGIEAQRIAPIAKAYLSRWRRFAPQRG